MFENSCGCIRVLSVDVAWKNLKGEVCEAVHSRELTNFVEEVGDVAFSLGRFLGACTGQVFVRVPGSSRTTEKMQRRLDEYGCVRSKRHLIDGCCPENIEK